MTDNTALIEALERAEGPSRELDAAIAKAVGWSPIPNPTSAGGLVNRWYRPDGTMSGHEGPPRFTASIDAAMTLLPEGWTRVTDNTGGREVVELYSPDYDGDAWTHDPNWIARGASDTPAIALCIAVLRASAAK